MCDAHVHIGYYSRKGFRLPFYYSPRRVVGVLNRCGVDEFVVSSTCAQIEEVGIDGIVSEAREVKRLAGRRAHVFFWLSGRLYDEDRTMSWMKTGLFEGIKFHEGETKWMKERKAELFRIIENVSELGYKVQFHCGVPEGCRPDELMDIARAFPGTHFDFAHCRPIADMAAVIGKCANVWTDVAYMAKDKFPCLANFDWRGRLLFGSDLPVWQAFENASLTRRYRSMVKCFTSTGLSQNVDTAFNSYLGLK